MSYQETTPKAPPVAHFKHSNATRRTDVFRIRNSLNASVSRAQNRSQMRLLFFSWNTSVAELPIQVAVWS